VVGLEACRIGIADQVQPVAAPSFAIPRRREQPVDQLLVRVRRFVINELLHLLRRRRKPVQVYVCAARQCPAIGFRSEAKLFLIEPAENEGVDRIPNPCGVAYVRNGGPYRLLERPPR